MALTSKQEKFCQGIVSGLNQSDAYRAAYSCDGMGDPTINNNAYVLMQNNDIAMRIEQLRLPIAERIGMGLEDYLKEMIALKSAAQEDQDHNPAIKAHELIGKCLGYYVNKTEISGSLAIDQLSDEELDKKLAEKLSNVTKK